MSVAGAIGCVQCTNPNGTIGFQNLTLSYKGYYSGGWYWGFSAPHCFYAPYYPQGYFSAYVTLRCDPDTQQWILYVQAQALLSYLQDVPGCPYYTSTPQYQYATCYLGYEGAVNVAVDGNGKFQGSFDVPLGVLYGSGADCCGANCTITFTFN